MTRLLNWLLPKKVDVPNIKPVLLSDVDAPLTSHPDLDETVKRERENLSTEIHHQQRTAAAIRRKLLTQTLERHTRGAH